MGYSLWPRGAPPTSCSSCSKSTRGTSRTLRRASRVLLPLCAIPGRAKGGRRGEPPKCPRQARRDGYIRCPPGGGRREGPGEHKQASSLMSRQDASSGRGARGGCAAGASMPPLFDEASGRAASDGRCAPALPAALDHFHAKPWPRHPPSCGPRAGGNAPAAAGAGGPGWAWEPRRQFQRRAAGRERPSGQGKGRRGCPRRGGSRSLCQPNPG